MPLLNLKELGWRLGIVDRAFVDLMKRREGLALQVGAFKEVSHDSIVRLEIEDDRLAAIHEYAAKSDINPNFAEAILYQLIGESCKVQLIQLQGGEKTARILPDDPDERYTAQKHNLIELTSKIASTYDTEADGSYPATVSFLEYEQQWIERLARRTQERELAIDLGCATGRITKLLGRFFKRSVGYDISQHMVVEAEMRHEGSHLEFEQADIEDGIPHADATVDFVVMNMGTGSDIRNLPFILSEIKRVLKHGGRFFISFYNADALISKVPFNPFDSGLEALIDHNEHCLVVSCQERAYKLFARPYTSDEIKDLIQDGLVCDIVLTYPTIGSMIPRAVLEQEGVSKLVADLDVLLAESLSGAYLIVNGSKT